MHSCAVKVLALVPLVVLATLIGLAATLCGDHRGYANLSRLRSRGYVALAALYWQLSYCN